MTCQATWPRWYQGQARSTAGSPVGTALLPLSHSTVTESLAAARGRTGRVTFAAAVPAYGLNEATADFVLLIVVVANCYLGWRHGLVRRALTFIGVFAGTIAAYYVGNPLSSTVSTGDLMSNAWAFIGVFCVVVVMVEILAALYSDLIQRTVIVMFDRVTGLAAGLVVGVVELGVLFLVAQAVANAPASTTTATPASRTTAVVAVDHGLLTQVVVKLEPGIQTLLGPALPGNLDNHLDGSVS